MGAQYTRKFVTARFKRFIAAIGPEKAKDLELEYIACYGGYAIHRNHRAMTGSWVRMSGKEICYWMDGAEWALRNKE